MGENSRYEEFKVSGDTLVAKVKELIRQGNVRRVYIKNDTGRTLLEIPLTAGVAVTAVTAAVAPVLVGVGAIAALLTQVTIGVELVDDDGSVAPPQDASVDDAATAQHADVPAPASADAAALVVDEPPVDPIADADADPTATDGVIPSR
ncbi:MAG: DUF4342 domain-containing protein [Cellulomonadaceae bacterium]